MLLPVPAYEPASLSWYLKLAFVWCSWLSWPLLGRQVWRLIRHWARWSVARRALALALLAVVLVFIDARFIERYRITVQETAIPIGVPARVALISDLHLGLYKSPAYLDRVVDRLNELKPDAVLIAGDLTYDPDRDLTALLAPLKRLTMPAYSVPGNHDEERPGPRLDHVLHHTLESLGVTPVEYTHADLGSFTLVGMGDRWAGKDGMAPVQAAPRGKPIVVLMHNPDSAMQLKPGMASLVLAGHTHGGQIRLPGLYRKVINSEHGFDRGLHAWAPVPVYVTSGMGESRVPLRWLVPPVIDILDLH